MKKFLLAFLFFISVAEMKISFAQTHYPFPDTLAQWNEYGLYEYTNWPEPTVHIFTGHLLTLSHDSIIGGKNYALVGLNFPWELDTNPMPYSINFPFQLPGTIIGGIRSDSNKRVWFYKLNDSVEYVSPTANIPLDSEILLYDFNIQVGDSLGWKTSNQKLLQIDSVQVLDGSWRREFVFGDFDKWIEGIGSTFGMFGAYGNGFPGEVSNWLSCFRKNDSLLFESMPYDNWDCDHLLTGISEVKSQNTTSVFPNPVSDFITFDLSNFPIEKFTLTIYNSSGQQVNHYSNLRTSQLTIPVSQLGSDGLYFYTVSFDDERIFAGKFLVQR